MPTWKCRLESSVLTDGVHGTAVLGGDWVGVEGTGAAAARRRWANAERDTTPVVGDAWRAAARVRGGDEARGVRPCVGGSGVDEPRRSRRVEWGPADEGWVGLWAKLHPLAPLEVPQV